jgi:hypothetical protein
VFWWVSRDMGVEMTCDGADLGGSRNRHTGTRRELDLRRLECPLRAAEARLR